MRHPFWILNTSLLLLLLVCAGFILFTQQTLPRKIERGKKSAPVKITVSTDMEPIVIGKIFENDLFDTYHEKIEAPSEQHFINPIPVPPSPSEVVIPENPTIPFLPPLAVTLKGIMIINDDSKNMVIVEDNATKKQETYKVGDSLEDAQLIRILYNKIILVRSNGQFETLYLSEKDILNQTPTDTTQDQWSKIIKRTNDYTYQIDPASFTELVTNLAHFIDLFDLTTVYKKGKSYGCRIGKVSSVSLPSALGFESYDTITLIADIAPTTTDNRLEIYKKITELPLESSFTVQFYRNEELKTVMFTLTDLKNPLFENEDDEEKEQKSRVGIILGPSFEELEEERIQLLKDRHTFAKTAQDILIEQRDMMSQAKKDTVNNVLLSNES